MINEIERTNTTHRADTHSFHLSQGGEPRLASGLSSITTETKAATGGKKRRNSPAVEAAPDVSEGRTDQEEGSDEILVDRVRAGDRDAFDLLYQRYFKRVYAFLDKRLSSREDAEETTQEVFINIFSSIDSFRGEAPFAAWVFGLTRRTLSTRFKRKRHATISIGDDDEDQLMRAANPNAPGAPSTPAGPLENYELTERARHLCDALANDLSPDQRQVFEMHHLESIPILEIAGRLSRSEDSIKSSLYRSRKILLAAR